MINIGNGAYIHCYEYDTPAIAAMRAIYYAPFVPENDSKMNNVVGLRVLRGTITKGEKLDGTE